MMESAITQFMLLLRKGLIIVELLVALFARLEHLILLSISEWNWVKFLYFPSFHFRGKS